MTDDLVKRLRELTCNCYDAEVIEAGKDAMDEAASRIEKLEAALREITWIATPDQEEARHKATEIARIALEDKQ